MGREFLFCFAGRGLPDAPLQWFSAGSFAACGPLDSSFRRGVSPPAGGEFLSQRWERNQRIAGGRLRMSAPRSYSPYPQTPITRDAYL